MSIKNFYRVLPLPELEFIAELLAILVGSQFNKPVIESELRSARAEIVRRTHKKTSSKN